MRDRKETPMVVQGFLFGIGIMAAFAVMSNIEAISLLVLLLIGVAATIVTVVAAILNPVYAAAIVAAIVAVFAFSWLEGVIIQYLKKCFPVAARYSVPAICTFYLLFVVILVVRAHL